MSSSMGSRSPGRSLNIEQALPFQAQDASVALTPVTPENTRYVTPSASIHEQQMRPSDDAAGCNDEPCKVQSTPLESQPMALDDGCKHQTAVNGMCPECHKHLPDELASHAILPPEGMVASWIDHVRDATGSAPIGAHGQDADSQDGHDSLFDGDIEDTELDTPDQTAEAGDMATLDQEAGLVSQRTPGDATVDLPPECMPTLPPTPNASLDADGDQSAMVIGDSKSESGDSLMFFDPENNGKGDTENNVKAESCVDTAELPYMHPKSTNKESEQENSQKADTSELELGQKAGEQYDDTDSDIVVLDRDDLSAHVLAKMDSAPWQGSSDEVQYLATRVKTESSPDVEILLQAPILHISANVQARNSGTRQSLEGQDYDIEENLSEYEPDDDEADPEETGKVQGKRRRQTQKAKQPARKRQKTKAVEELDADKRQDLADQLKIWEIEQSGLLRRQKKGQLTNSQEKKLKSLEARLKKHRERLGIYDDDDGDDDSADLAPANAEHPSAAQDGEQGQSLRQDTQQELTAKPKKKTAKSRKLSAQERRERADEVNRKILNFYRDDDPILARAEVGEDWEALDDITATGAVDQERQLKSKINWAALSDAEKAKYRGDERLLRAARVAFGKKMYKAEGNRYRIKGMHSLLHPFQFAGAGWMLAREKGEDNPRGGLLGDSMGLGKTVMTLALCLGNRPPQSVVDKEEGAVLVVVPASAVSQWKREIEKHCSERLFVMQYKQGEVDDNQISRPHILIASYDEVRRGYPSQEFISNLLSQKLSMEERESHINRNLGPLFRVKFWRIILDEAHMIKNFGSQTSKACLRLQAEFKWLLTGTPLHNCNTEAYPYLRFLDVQGIDDYRSFKKTYQIGNKTDDLTTLQLRALAELEKLFSRFMIKRTINTDFLGKRLFYIPRTHPLPNVEINFSKEETIIYRRVENNFRNMLNDSIRKGTAKRRMGSFLSLVLRLRQATAHPYLLYPLLRDHFEIDDIRWLKAELNKLKNDTPFVNQVGRWCETLENRKIEGAFSQDLNSDDFGSGKFGHEFDMDPQLELVERVKLVDETMICGLCHQPPADSQITKCRHVFCFECIEGHCADASLSHEHRNNGARCPSCRAVLPIRTPYKPLVPADQEELADPSGTSARSQRRRAPRDKRRGLPDVREPGDDFLGFQPLGQADSAGFLHESDRRTLLSPSAKTTAVTSIILKWQEDAPQDKIIVFVQWVLLMRILGRVLEGENIPFVYMCGEMLSRQKDQAVSLFRDNPDVKVMIAGLKCGGQALNLECANRVILVDLWWNHAMEKQAFGRVFRLGQIKETYFVRIMARQTIDQRLFNMQVRKLQRINHTIKDWDPSQYKPKLEDVANMFGRVRKNADGQLVVESDYEDEQDDETDEKEAGRDSAEGGIVHGDLSDDDGSSDTASVEGEARLGGASYVVIEDEEEEDEGDEVEGVEDVLWDAHNGRGLTQAETKEHAEALSIENDNDHDDNDDESISVEDENGA